MSFIVTIVHVGVSLFLMLTVLLQAGKGGGMGATFGGGSSQGSVFGGSGAGNFLSKLTTFSAAIFMLTSMTLAYLASTTGEDPLKNVSRQARASAAEKKKLDQQAQDLFNSTQPDAGLTDELPESSFEEPVDLDDSDVETTDSDKAEGESEAAPVEESAGETTTTETTAPPAPKPAAESKPAAAPKPTTEPKPASSPKPTTEPKPASAPKPTTEPKPASKPKRETVPEPKPAAEPASAPAAGN